MNDISSHRIAAGIAADANKRLRTDLSATALLNAQLSDKMRSCSIGTEMTADAKKVLQAELSAASLRNERPLWRGAKLQNWCRNGR